MSSANVAENLVSGSQIFHRLKGEERKMKHLWKKACPMQPEKKATEKETVEIMNKCPIPPSLSRAPTLFFLCTTVSVFFNHCNSGPPVECLHLPLPQT